MKVIEKIRVLRSIITNLHEKYCENCKEWDCDYCPFAIEMSEYRGNWLSVPDKRDRICSICGSDEPYKFANENVDVFDYCPHCGAKMKRSEE